MMERTMHRLLQQLLTSMFCMNYRNNQRISEGVVPTQKWWWSPLTGTDVLMLSAALLTLKSFRSLHALLKQGPKFCKLLITSHTTTVILLWKRQKGYFTSLNISQKFAKCDDRMGREVQCRMLCMIGVPSQITLREILLFIGGSIQTIERIKVIRDSTPNEYMIILKFKSHVERCSCVL
ncbi:hypothetical protein ANCCAN_28897 [Ancylostoma caninum]|uniref:BRCA1-associated 2/ETP1 RRM domain-containing protein n=1 Tax=Ancylostoma caninum TaxID=29170 RepID=A0A368F002_ANCCA|nr:hypothetical protein ANCCAN_28897 [Ancylostoma caninum]